MKTLDFTTAKTLNSLVEFIELTEGKDGLQKLTSVSGIKEAFKKYQDAYEAFCTKFLNSREDVKEILITKMCSEVWLQANIRRANEKINGLLK